MSSFRKLSAVIMGASFALGVGVARHSDVLAAGGSGPVPDPMAPAGLDAAGAVIDAEAFEEVTAITERITPHLVVGADGQVRLGSVSAAELGVSEEFLSNFRLALESSNRAIAEGHVVVHPDLTVTVNEQAVAAVAPGKEGRDVALLGAAPSEPVPDWGAWRYPQGAIFYNTYPDWTYYRNAYFGLCNTMAAYLGYPWMSTSLIYFYGYNQIYFSRYCYNPLGVYWYVPYSYCQLGLGYKPAYFWTQMPVFNYGCGCYRYQWAWQGFWCRY